MSINSVLTMRYPAEQPSAEFNPRLQANQGEGDSWCSTALKIAGVIGAIIASIGSFVFLGPIVGLIATLSLGTAGLAFFNVCGPNAHDHARDASVPWYQRIFSFIPNGVRYMDGSQPHIQVGGGHIGVGAGHGHPPGQAHIPVGRGHAPQPHGHGHPPGPAHGHGHPPGPPPHIPVGRGHAPQPHGHQHAPHGGGQSNDPRVPVGRRH